MNTMNAVLWPRRILVTLTSALATFVGAQRAHAQAIDVTDASIRAGGPLDPNRREWSFCFKANQDGVKDIHIRFSNPLPGGKGPRAKGGAGGGGGAAGGAVPPAYEKSG